MVYDGFHEYLELYSYFGRGDLPRLRREEFEVLDGEMARLLELERPLSDENVRRVAKLKALLLRDRPRLSELRRAR